MVAGRGCMRMCESRSHAEDVSVESRGLGARARCPGQKRGVRGHFSRNESARAVEKHKRRPWTAVLIALEPEKLPADRPELAHSGRKALQHRTLPAGPGCGRG